eukprot:TRINITY_DN29008_c0_g4_i2.p1 TRINITY_DN29008_c0_g4~~TRINITY_DN29008_c0_g4_i2.p1  ORF type:complete len:601 (+),score=105.04 TRINITY_DN29008_c0_g4_i2:31-1803(+)
MAALQQTALGPARPLRQVAAPHGRAHSLDAAVPDAAFRTSSFEQVTEGRCITGVVRSCCAVAGASLTALARAGRRRLPRGRAARRAESGGMDFAIIRFRIPGFDDLSMLPRVIAGLCFLVLVYNKVTSTPIEGDDVRALSEAEALVLAACCWPLPWVGNRLQEASKQQGCLQTLAIEESLPYEVRIDISWCTSVLLRLTNADGLAIWHNGGVICTRGTLKQLPGFAAGAKSVLTALSAAWMPASASTPDGYCATSRGLSSFPSGSLPSAVLPGDTESVIAKPLPGGGVLVLWSALPRAFDRLADRQWVSNAAAKLGSSLNGATAASAEPFQEVCYEDDLPLVGSSEEVASRDPFARFDQQIRAVPAIIGLVGFAVLLWNRKALLFSTLSKLGIDPAQTRADLVAGVMATTLFGQGMVWLSETPKQPEIQDTSEWDDCQDVLSSEEVAIGATACEELEWAWRSLRSNSRASSMAVFWRGSCVMQGGLFQPGVKPVLRDFCREVMSTGKGRYLAQLPNYPVKDQFLDFLPGKTQGLLLTPLCPARNAPAAGILVLGLDAIRGLGKVDQAWVGALAEKLAVSLDEGARAAAVA